MSESEANAATKPGPANPAAAGVDAPTPPGGPQRQDDATTTPDAERPVSRDGSSTIPIEDEGTHPERVAAEPEDFSSQRQQENAGTSFDEPSGT